MTVISDFPTTFIVITIWIFFLYVPSNTWVKLLTVLVGYSVAIYTLLGFEFIAFDDAGGFTTFVVRDIWSLIAGLLLLSIVILYSFFIPFQMINERNEKSKNKPAGL